MYLRRLRVRGLVWEVEGGLDYCKFLEVGVRGEGCGGGVLEIRGGGFENSGRGLKVEAFRWVVGGVLRSRR